jgi:hypothetical protein
MKELALATLAAARGVNTATRHQLAGFDISRSDVSKIEARLRFVDDKDLMFLAEVLKVPIQELFPRRESSRVSFGLYGEVENDAILTNLCPL